MQRIKRILIIETDRGFCREITWGVDAYCRAHGAWEIHEETVEHPLMIHRAKLAIRQWKAEGIIAQISTPAVARLVRGIRLPIVNVSAALVVDIPTVKPDDIAIGKMAAQYFLERRYRNIAYCARTVEQYTQDRCDAFLDHLSKHSVGCDVFTDQCTAIGEANWVNNRRRMEQWLRSLKKPVAILCIYDLRTLEICRACERLGLKIPDDVVLVGMGNDENLCLKSNPPLSSLDYNVRQIGYEAVQLLDRLMRGGKAPTQPILIPPRQIVSRQSSDAGAVEDPTVTAVIRFIREHSQEPISVKSILQKFSISRTTLERHFKKIFGHTPGTEIMRIRIERAKNLLMETTLPIKIVAQKIGFVNPRIFADFFRRNVGMRPSQYRQSGKTIAPSSQLAAV